MNITGLRLYTIITSSWPAPIRRMPGISPSAKLALDPNKPGFGVELKRELRAPFKS